MNDAPSPSKTADGQRLAAILFADIAGYTELMHANEAATYEAWRRARAEAVEPTVAAHRGRIVKFTGDGFLAEFPAAESAVTCAVKLQAAMAGREPLRLRMGIHLGDIYLEGGDVYGDGVNVASRLEGLAQPGGVCISGTVHDLVRKKVPVEFVDGGRQPLKHIAEPVQVWHIRPKGDAAALGGPAVPRPAGSSPVPPTPVLVENLKAAFKRPAIAVLPFDNLSGDAEQEYFADGLAEDLITELSRTGTLFVTARNSTFVYKKQAVDVPKVARDLGVNFVLEGSVRRAGQRVRVNAQLIDGKSGGHVWAERFDRDLTDIFAVQDEITRNIVAALSLSLSPTADRHLGRKSTRNIEAYDLFLRGRELLIKTERDTAQQAKLLFEEAIALDPGFASAHAGLGQIYTINFLNGWGDDPKGAEQRAVDESSLAVRLNPLDPYAHWSMSSILIWQRDYEGALAAAYRSIEIDPSFLVAYSNVGGAMIGLRRYDEAVAIFDTILLGGSAAPSLMLHFRARALFMQKRFEECVATLRNRILRSPDTDVSRALLASVYGHMGKKAEAKAIWEELWKVNPAYSLEARRAVLPPEEFALLTEGIEKAGLAVPQR
jgi:TolB-like protein/class 3 adenylate cyclase/tetratricopeptide (TPR) repeat protein